MTPLRIVLGLLAGLALAWAGYLVYEASLDDETKVRRVIEIQAPAFNEASARGLSGFDYEFRDRTANLSRRDLHALLLYVFRTERDPHTREFRMRIELPVDEIVIEAIDTEAGTARARFRAELFRREGESETSLWDVEVSAEFARSEEHGWQFVRSEHRTLRGDRPRLGG